MTRDELPEEKRTRCEVWTRVMGYHRPVSGYNEGKKAEFKERKYFVEAKIGQCCGELK
jgi:hypothetical protein